MLLKSKKKYIEDEFIKNVCTIFGDNLKVGFIFGSVAKNKACENNSDIDMFIITNKAPTKILIQKQFF